MKTFAWLACAILPAAGIALAAGKAPHQEPEPAVHATSAPLLFQQSGCGQCHTIRGEGGHKGPELTHVGRRLKPAQIQQQILDGGDMMPPYREALTTEDTALLVQYLHKLR